MKSVLVILLTILLTSFSGSLFSQASIYSNCSNCLSSSLGFTYQSALGDYDNDGDLDLLIGGLSNMSGGSSSTQTQQSFSYLFNNDGSGNFTQNTGVNFTGMNNGEFSWADYNGDGLLDFAAMGINDYFSSTSNQKYTVLQVYPNRGNGQFGSPVSLGQGLVYGGLDWGDYDGDGDQDLIVTGCTGIYSSDAVVTKIYSNNSNGNFSPISTSLPNVCYGNAKWGDFDNDGDLDVLLCGQTTPAGSGRNTSNAMTRVYRNDGNNQFVDIQAGLIAVTAGYAAWGDYDNDGYLDIAVNGEYAQGSILKIYRNNHDGTFLDLNLEVSSNFMGNLVWGDFSGDGKLDLISNGYYNTMLFTQTGTNQFSLSQTISGQYPVSVGDINHDTKLDLIVGSNYNYVYLNTGGATPSQSNTPANLQSLPFGNSVYLLWDPQDGNNNLNGLTYNLYLGTSSRGINKISPNSDLNSGFRKVVRDGNMGHGNSAVLEDLPQGTYYWGVQSENAAMNGSTFSAEGNFTIPGNSNFLMIRNTGNNQLCGGQSTTLEALTYPAPSSYQWYSYQWYLNNVAIPNAYSQEYLATQSGNYTVHFTNSQGTFTSDPLVISAGAILGVPTTSNTSVCQGQSETLTATPGSGGDVCRWYDQLGYYLYTGNSYTPNPAPTSTTSYHVYTYNSSTGCSSTTYSAPTLTVNPLPAQPQGYSQSFCEPTSFTLSATTSTQGAICQWFDQPSGGNLLGEGVTFTTPVLQSSTTYYVGSLNTATNCVNNSRTPITASISVPPGPPTTTDAEICNAGSVTLYANPGANANTCRWYNAANGGSPIYTGTSYTIQDLTADQILFVSSFNSSLGCEGSQRVPVTATVNPSIQAPFAWDQTRYGTSTVTLEAWPGAGGTTCRWYSNSSKSTLLATGDYYTTPSLNYSTTYYVTTYNADLGCESADIVPVQVTISPTPTVVVNPDQVYPIPANLGEESYKNVNLFTGDLNLSVPLVEIGGPFISYSLNAFYNSRSADITPHFTANPLGGLGWKLLDYPKIVEDGTSNQFYLLDGMRAHLLDTVAQTSTSFSFNAGGEYHLWSITMENIQSSLGNRTWKIVTEDGTVYKFNSNPVGHLDNNKPGYRWDLSTMVEAQRRDSLQFSYSNGRLNSIQSYDHSVWSFAYDNYSRISSITEMQEDYRGYNQKQVNKVLLNYDITFPGTSSKVLSALHFQQNLSPSSSAAFEETIAPILFTYNSTNYPGALNSMQVSQGGSIEYEYSTFPYNGQTYHPVTASNSFSGTTFSLNGQTQHQFSPATIRYSIPKVSGDQMYLHYNETEVIPGGNQLYDAIGDQSTSFENGTNDPVFKDLDHDYIVSTYALSGNKSYFFDGVVLDNSIHSKRFTLNQKEFAIFNQTGSTHNPVSMSGAEDSVRVAFYAFDTHDYLTIDFLWNISFYDSKNKKISSGSAGGNRTIDSENYGNWVPVEIVHAIPSNAASFEFKIIGGRSADHHDFYMDDLSVSGSHQTLNGKITYHFFNGKSASHLNHLPGDYFTPYPDEQVKGIYETGFESGEGYSDWLNTSHSSDCKPKVTQNDGDRLIAHNGSYAMGLRACDDKYAKIYPRNELNIPSGTDRVLLAFTYSSPEFTGMQFKVEGNVGNTTWDSTLTATGSYFSDPRFTYFYKWFSVSNTSNDFGFTIRATDGGDDIGMNEFFVDDLRIVFLDLDNSAPLPSPTVQDSKLLGTAYHAATITQDNQELEAVEYFYIPGTDRTDGNIPIQQLYRSLNVQQGVAEQYLSYQYYPDGRTKSTRTTQEMQVPGGTYQQVWYNETYTYADSLYPALGRDSLHLLTALKATVNSYSTNGGSNWSLLDANIAMWKSMQPPAMASGNTLAPIWVSFANYIPRQLLSLSSVNAVIAGTTTQHPPNSHWIRSSKTLALDAFGQEMESQSADSIIAWQLSNATSYTDANSVNWARDPVTIAQFGDATPLNSFYWGFEAYETKPATASWYRSSVYSFLGDQSAQGNLSFTIPFSKASIPGDQYLVAFQYLAPNSNSGVRLSITGTNFSSSTDFYPATGQNKHWQAVQKVVSIPDGVSSLDISISYIGSSVVFTDDFRLLPAPSSFTAMVYDIQEYEAIGVLDNNGAEMRTLRNRSGVSNITIGPNKVPLAFQTEYMPKTQGSYDPLHPNEAYSITVRDGGHYFAFNDYEDRYGWSISGSSPTFENGSINFSRTCTSRIPAAYYPTYPGNFGVSGQVDLQLSSSSTTVENGFKAGSYQFIIRSQKSGSSLSNTLYLAKNGSKTSIGTYTLQTSTTNPVLDFMVIFQQNHIHVWFNDQYISNSYSFTPESSAAISLVFTQVSGSSLAAFSNFTVFNSPEIRATFTDGLDNVLQTQEVNGNDLIVQETLYDLMYRAILQTKQVSLPNTYPGFAQGFVTSFDWQSGEMLGSVQNAKNYVMNGKADQKYMYWRSEYAGSPEEQRSMLFNPGYDFALRAQTNIEKAEKWAYEHEEEIMETIKYSLDVVQIIIDPESAPVVIGMDLLDLVQKHFTNTTDNTEKEVAITTKYYDPYQRQIQIGLPWSNASKNAKPNHILTYDYAFNGSMIYRQTPESGITRYASDDLGRVRFSQDSAQAALSIVQYYKYDRWSRPIETGVISSSWDQSSLENLAENEGYPVAGMVVENRWYYDGAEGNSAFFAPNRGKNTQTETYTQNVLSVTENNAFDLMGNLTSHTQTMTSNIISGAYTTLYHYDNGGNITLIQYPAWNGHPFQVRYSYDYLGNLKNIGDSTAINAYASYDWNPDGSLYHESLMQTNHQVLPAWHWYNAPGWEDFHGYGDTVRVLGLEFNPWTIVWPEFSYTFSLFSLDLDYNLLSDWWSDLWGQQYFNGDIASSTYTPGPNNVTKSLKQGYTYNEYGNLGSYYSNYVDNHYYDQPWYDTRKIQDVARYDLNNNLVKRDFERDLSFGSSGFKYRYSISDNHNHLEKMTYEESASYNNYRHYQYDTLDLDYGPTGNVELLHWVKRNTTQTKGQPGSIAFQYWKRLNYDFFGNLSTATYRDTYFYSDSSYTRFLYDSHGLRAQKQVKTYRGNVPSHTRNTTYYRNASGDPMMEIITGGSRDTVKYYVYGPDGITVMYLNDNYSTKSWFVLKDNLGTAKQLVDRSDRSVDEYYATSDYGAMLWGDMRYNGLFNYIYTGQEYDRELDLHYFRARMYDPFSQIFLSPDPAGSNPATPYAFVGNNPANATDPTGKIPFDAILGASDAEILEAQTELAGVSTERLMNALPSGEGGALNPNAAQRKCMIEFRRRFNTVGERAVEFANIRFNQPVHSKMGRILRPGGKHEMLMVSEWKNLREIGVKLEDIQAVTRPTGDTYFQAIDPRDGQNYWMNHAIPHGRSVRAHNYDPFAEGFSELGYDHNSIGSGKAHKEIATLIQFARDTNYSKRELVDLMNQWMAGEIPEQLLRVHESQINDWIQLMNTIR